MRQHIRDMVALGGVGLLGYGAWLAWQPAGFMVAGAILVLGWAFAIWKGAR